MEKYKCPVCHKEMPRDLQQFLDHAEEHVIQEIKKRHPEWIEKDGLCRKCVEYYRNALKGESA